MYKYHPSSKVKAFLLPGAAAALFAASAMADYSSTVLSYSPLGYWKLNETNLPTADVATNTGTLGAAGNGFYASGAVHPSTGAIVAESSDSAAKFPDVSGNRVVVPWSSQLASASPFTVEFWANPTATNSGDSSTMCPVSHTQFGEPAGAGDGTRKGWLFYQTAGTGWIFRTYGDGNAASAATATVTVTPGTWYHVVGVHDGTNNLLYVNGQLVASAAAASYVPVPENRAPFSVGARGYGSLGFFRYNGSVDEVAYYTNILSATDILAHYQNGISSSPATPYAQVVQAKSPLVYLRFNEPAFTEPDVTTQPVAKNYGTAGADGDGNYLPGSNPGIAGAPWTGIATPHLGTLFGPDRLESYVNAGVSGNFDFSGPFSVVLWFRESPNTSFQSFIGKADSSWRGGVDGDGHARFAFGTGSSNPDAIGKTYVGDDKWHQFAGVFDGTANLYLYIDGYLDGQAVISSIPSGSTNALLIGSVGDYGDSRVFKGGMDEVAVFDQALTMDQVTNIYLTANPPPSFPSISSAVSGPEGTSLSIGGTVFGPAPITCQWAKNGTNIVGATATTLTFSSLKTNDAANYTLIAKNIYGSSTSSIVALTVVSGPPVYTGGTVTNVLYAGSTLQIPVAISGSAPLTYQWYLNGTAVSGQTTTTLKQTNLKTTQSGSYALVASNPYGSISNVIAVVTVIASPTSPYATAVLADSPISYWRLDETNGVVAYDVVGANNGTYNNVTQGQPGYSSSDSDKAAKFGPTIPSYVDAGTNINFASAANRSFTIEAWVKGPLQSGDVGIITKGTGAGGEQFNLDTGNGGAFRFFVREAGGGAKLASSNVKPDGAWHHLVAVVDASSSAINFYVDGTDVADASLGTGILASSHAISIGARQSGSGAYDLQFNGVIDEVAIYNTALTWNQVTAHFEARFADNAVPVIYTSPASTTNYPGVGVAFSVDADGPDLAYQWQFNDTDIPGENASTYTIPSTTSASAGKYRVIVSNNYGSATSDEATLTLVAAPPILDISSNLVLHLPFDSDSTDISGHGNNGTNVGSPTFVAGKIGGGAVHYVTTTGGDPVAVTSASYVTLGQRSDLNFSSNVNFSVAFWVQLPAGASPGDLPFFATAVGSTYSAGLTFAPSYKSGGWAFSLNGTEGEDANPVINDGSWHHLAFTFDRSSYANAYLDGALSKTILIAPVGNVDQGTAAVVGQDPTGKYGEAGEASIDDLGVWRRVLTPFEVASIYAAGAQYGVSFAIKPISLSVGTSGSQVKIVWTGGVLQVSDTVTGTFTTVSGATSPYLVTPTTAAKFYRVKAQ